MIDLLWMLLGACLKRVVDVQRIILPSLLGLFMFLHAGCRTAIVSGNKLDRMPGIPRLSRNGPGGSFWTKNAHGTGTHHDEPCRIKYHSSYWANRWMVVEGKIDSGRKYPVILDTGASVALFVNDIHIIENKLAFEPVESSSDDSAGWGRCRLPQLRIGRVKLHDWPCFYREQHTELQLFGLPLARGKAMIAGLPVLQSFKYVMFDSISREVELSLDRTFEPERSDAWVRYPLRIEGDPGGNVFLFVSIPIAGQVTELQLDTGSGRGLAITEELWEKMGHAIGRIKLRSGKDLYPYVGSLPCRRAIFPKLEVGGRTVGNARISIFPNDSPIMGCCSGLLGMQFFQDTAMVLDFDRDLMWVKNSSHR